ncbi:MAG TPA: hypothetical protein VHI99_18545 [Vicinamibacterales bacterium]|jgi:hypothetical protein|nr:hypothetical protein [Vicinamibacterales bacterium]
MSTRGRLRVSGLIAVALFTGSSVRAQGPDRPSLDDLKAPPSPAFVLLDVSPSKVERPQSVRPLVLSALSAISTEGFPKNYAVEFAPYWLGTPQISFDQYYNSTVGQSLVRHLSVSVATTPLEGADGTSIGFGARTLPFPGRPHPKLQALRDKLTELQLKVIDEEGFFSRHDRLIALLQEAQGAAVRATAQELATKPFEDLVDRMIDLDIEIQKREIERDDINNDLDALKSLPLEQQQAKKAELDERMKKVAAALADARKQRSQLAGEMLKAVELSDIAKNLATEKQFEILVARYDQAQKVRAARLNAELRRTALAIQELDTRRVGFLLSVATALAWDIPDDQTRRTSLSRVGLWVTPGYSRVRCTGTGASQTCSTALDLLGVVRYLDDRRTPDSDTIWELGGRVIWRARTKLALSGEWLGRTGDDEPGSRLVGVAEYEITDSIFLYASFGRDFEEAGARRNLVSTIGLSFGLGKRPIIGE